MDLLIIIIYIILSITFVIYVSHIIYRDALKKYFKTSNAIGFKEYIKRTMFK